MENYESLGTIGEGTYGVVLKCRHKTTGQIVAIKKFKESDDDEQVKKTALREIKILKQLKHENIVSLLEVFRVKGKLYLVFEFVEKTILEEIEKNPEGLDVHSIKRLMWQLVRAIHFCHQHNIIHRDIKPENLLVSRNGVLKLCDFGFARPLAGPGAKYTEYVSTRWYRAPELLVGDVSYGKAVDVWSIGCMFAEITTGLPLFPGDSDIDQLYHIIKCLGHITARQQELFRKNSLYVGVKLPHATELEPLLARFPQLDKNSIDFLRQTIQDEPLDRWTCAELLKHPFFDNSGDLFEAELQDAIARDLNDSAAIRKKRNRKQPSRGDNGGNNTGGNLPSPTLSVQSTVPYDDPTAFEQQARNALKATFKPILANSSMQPYQQPTGKDKLVSHSSSNSSNSHVISSKKGNTALIGSSGGGYHLPTLHGMMTSSSSTSSTSSSGETSPYGYSKKLGVLSIAENQASSNGSGVGIPVGADHMEFINQHGSVRQSMTSHGGRHPAPSNALVHPYSFGAAMIGGGAPPLKPPPTSYMKNPYLAQTPISKPRTNANGSTTSTAKQHPSNGHGNGARHGGYANCTSLQSSSDVYSPKKVSNGQVAAATHQGGKKANGGGMALDLTPQGIYVPPRTSHSTLRGSMTPSGEKVAKVRRDNDARSF